MVFRSFGPNRILGAVHSSLDTDITADVTVVDDLTPPIDRFPLSRTSESVQRLFVRGHVAQSRMLCSRRQRSECGLRQLSSRVSGLLSGGLRDNEATTHRQAEATMLL